MLVMTVVFMIYLAILISIPVLIGVYVYKDAKKRGMSPVPWTLIAVLAPALIGFIIYLLVRGSYSDLECPNCGETVTRQYVSCPNCGQKLKALCPNCSGPVEKEWKVCPGCGRPLPKEDDSVSGPVRKKDKMLGRILLVVILIPVLFIGIVLFSFMAFTSSSGGLGTTSLSADEYLKAVKDPQIEQWLENCGEDLQKAYVLRNETAYEQDISAEQETGKQNNRQQNKGKLENREGNKIETQTDNPTPNLEEGQTQVQYLIYMPCLPDMPEISLGHYASIFGNTIQLNVQEASGSGGNTLLLVTWTGEEEPKLKIKYGGRSISCEITDTESSLALPDSF